MREKKSQPYAPKPTIFYNKSSILLYQTEWRNDGKALQAKTGLNDFFL